MCHSWPPVVYSLRLTFLPTSRSGDKRMPTKRIAGQFLTRVGLLLLVCSPAGADEKLAGIACRSVHLGYPAPEGAAFYNEVTVEKSAAGTYFMACGFDQGYFGIQELADGKKLVLFSVWDPGEQN